jgi:hypothetical protein
VASLADWRWTELKSTTKKLKLKQQTGWPIGKGVVGHPIFGQGSDSFGRFGADKKAKKIKN